MKNKKWLTTSAVISQDESIAVEFLRKVKTENDIVYFQKLPPADILLPTPTEKVLVSIIAYEPLIKKQNLFLD